jgi:hypothetical protein
MKCLDFSSGTFYLYRKCQETGCFPSSVTRRDEAGNKTGERYGKNNPVGVSSEYPPVSTGGNGTTKQSNPFRGCP